MNELFRDPTLQQVINDVANGEITLFTGVFWVMILAAISIVGGMIGGICLGGKSLGGKIAATIGGLFVPAAVIPATIIVLVVINFHNNCSHLDVAIDVSRLDNNSLSCADYHFLYHLDTEDCLSHPDSSPQFYLVDASDRLVFMQLE